MRIPTLLAPLALLACGAPGTAPEADLSSALQKGHKVAVCHVARNGSTRELSIAKAAVSAHLAHGDHLAGAWYPDDDGDGFGDEDATATRCKVDSTDVEDNTDCDDDASTAYPGNEEIIGDGIDNDCDGEIDEGGGCPCTASLDIGSEIAAMSDLYYCFEDFAPSGSDSALTGIQANTLDNNGVQEEYAVLSVSDGDTLGCSASYGSFDGGPTDFAVDTDISASAYDACLDEIDTYKADYGCDVEI